MQELKYPVHRLNLNITDFLKNVTSADILQALYTGLKNEVKFFDNGTHLTDVAYIKKHDATQTSQVYISSAFCQYYWLICDVALKILDRRVIADACKESNISLDQFLKSVEQTNLMTKEQILPHLPAFFRPEIERYLAYLKIVPDLLEKDFQDKMGEEFSMAVSLMNKNTPIDIESMNAINLNGKYSERTNSVYCYGIAFIMLHELAHHQLHHLEKKEEAADEVAADSKAFWDIFKDVTGEKRFSANTAMICVYFSYMMLNPSLFQDKVHPREDKRLFAVYDSICGENPKFTVLLVQLLDFWAVMCNRTDYPKNLPPTTESVAIIKDYFGKQKPVYLS